jgi:hypothetical protein
MKGTWYKATHGTDYDYQYNKKVLIVDLLADGDYKINYGGGK